MVKKKFPVELMRTSQMSVRKGFLMKKLFLVLFLASVFTAWMSAGFATSAQNDDEKKSERVIIRANIAGIIFFRREYIPEFDRIS